MKRRDAEIALVLSRIHAMKNGGGHPHPLNMDGKKLDPATRTWLEARLKALKEDEAKQKVLDHLLAENEAKLYKMKKELEDERQRVELLRKQKEKEEVGYRSLADALKDIKDETKK